ncbi:MAG: hypothetical protein M3443_13570 [Actinomycetota bacterium]|nr:hypothetical protein [Actinomycetota bacterium]
MARQRGWPFAVRGGGHSNACHSSSDGLVGAEPRPAEIEDLPASDAALLHATPYSAVAHDSVSMTLTHDRPGMSAAKTEFFDQSSPVDAVRTLVEHFRAGRVRGEIREVAFTPWRGVYGRVSPQDTAFTHRDAA